MQFFDIFKKQEKPVSTITIDSEFKLPIDYLDAAVVHTLSPIVITDLELDSCVYEMLLDHRQFDVAAVVAVPASDIYGRAIRASQNPGRSH